MLAGTGSTVVQMTALLRDYFTESFKHQVITENHIHYLVHVHNKTH